MTPAQWAEALLSPAGQVTVFVGAMVSLWLVVTALIWGVRKGVYAAKYVAYSMDLRRSGVGYTPDHDDLDDDAAGLWSDYKNGRM